jgi:hypothetical protein
MPWTIIVASREGDQLEALIQGAQEVAAAITEPGTVVMQTESIGKLRNRRKSAAKHRQLLIVVASLPDETNPTATESGLELVRMSAQETDAPLCIVVSADPNHLAAVQENDRWELLLVNCKTNYVPDCHRLARRLGVFDTNVPAQLEPSVSGSRTAGNEPASPKEPIGNTVDALEDEPSPYAVIEVHLWEKARAFLTLPGQSPLPLELNELQVEDIVTESRALAARIDKARADNASWQEYVRLWREEYKRLGERVGNLLWPTLFGSMFWASLSASRGNLRLRFNLAPRYFDGAWEAIFDTQYSKDFVMLGADVTVARRTNYVDARNIPMIGRSSPTSTRIEAADGVLKILAIDSNVPYGSTPVGPDDPLWREFWSRQNGTLADLPHIRREIDMLRGLARVRGGVDRTGRVLPRIEVEVLSPRIGMPLAKIVERRLKDRSRHYDVVHFAGHALFDRGQNEDADRRGYLVFAGQPGDPPTAEPIGSVAEWLRGSDVQLVYLSCCRSSSGDAASELAALKVPLTIGFNWNLDDSKAVDFATNFYTELMAARFKVCEAFRKARRTLYQYFNGGDPIWAAPVLIAQPNEWIQVEGVLRPMPDRTSVPRKPPGRPSAGGGRSKPVSPKPDPPTQAPKAA